MSSSSSSSGRQIRAAPAAAPSVLSTINEQRASVPAVAADDPSSVQQEDASRVGLAPSPLPTGRIDTIDEVVIIDGTLKEADDDANNTNEKEREDRQN